LFEIQLSSVDSFKRLIKALSVIVEEGSFNVDEGELKLLAMDPSHVAMVDFELPREFFDEYLCDEETKLTVNIRELLKFLDRVERGEQVRMKLEEGRLSIECVRGGHKRRFLIPLLEPLEEETPTPKIFFKASARILTPSLKRAIKDASLVGEHVKLEINEEEFKISAEGDVGSVSSVWTLEAEDLLELKVEEPSSATFTLSYLQDIINAASASSEVATLELSTDMPIKLNFEIPKGRLIYYLAPCIGV